LDDTARGKLFLLLKGGKEGRDSWNTDQTQLKNKEVEMKKFIIENRKK
jgi:hypothetical protein